MPTVEQSVEIALPPKDVWEYIAVAENWPNWENSMVECKQITDGPMAWEAAGTVSRESWASVSSGHPNSPSTTHRDRRNRRPSKVRSASRRPRPAKKSVTALGSPTDSTAKAAWEEYSAKMADPIVTKAFSRTVRVSLENLADILVHAE